LQRQIQETKLGSNKDQLDTSKEIPTNFYCSEELRTITSAEAAVSRSFSFVNLTNPDKMNLHIRSYVDYYGGYAEHGRNVIFGLNESGMFNIKLTPIKTPIDIDPIVWNKLNWFTKNPNFKMDSSVLMTIAGPGWMQTKYLSPERLNIGWTMIESLEAHPDMIKWLGNCDYVLCPTDTDIRRFRKAKTGLAKMHLGYDDKKYHLTVPPMDIVNCRGRFVFGVLGSWNKRKNVKAIIQAFVKEFKKEEPVTLLLCCKYGTRPFGSEAEYEERWTIKYEFNQYLEEIGKSIEECPHIVLLDLPLHENAMPNLMSRFDCLVGFSMGESTWLPGLQAMGMRIPIIQLTATSNGCMEYLHDVGFLCKEGRYTKADEELYDGTSEYYKDQLFAEGNVEELSGMMRYIYKDYDRLSKGDKVDLGYRRAVDWTWAKSIESLSKFLRALA